MMTICILAGSSALLLVVGLALAAVLGAEERDGREAARRSAGAADGVDAGASSAAQDQA